MAICYALGSSAARQPSHSAFLWFWPCHRTSLAQPFMRLIRRQRRPSMALLTVLPTNCKDNTVYWEQYCVQGTKQVPLQETLRRVRLPATVSQLGHLLYCLAHQMIQCGHASVELLTSRGESEPPKPRYDEHHDRRSVLFWGTSCLGRRKVWKFHGALCGSGEASGSGCLPCVFNSHFLAVFHCCLHLATQGAF